MEGRISFTASEWQALVAVIPGGGGEADVQLREKLFKELVVRAAAAPENRFKVKTGFKGTLKLSDIEVPLKVILGKKEISPGCIDAVLSVQEQAFAAAQKWVNSISVIEPASIDMNQFHAFIIYIACYLSLWSLACPTSSNTMLDATSFRGLLEDMADPRKAAHGIPWASIGVFRSWQERPQAAFGEMANRDGRIPFINLANTCISHVVQALVVSDEFSNSCRKRAFQLLQALNNMPSLPNAVPGPLSARTETSMQQTSARQAEPKRKVGWSTSNREGFPVFTPRVPQAAYAPAIQPTQRDMQWRVFPITVPKLQSKNSFATAGGMIASEPG
jgi:hypothetical protein